MDGEDAKIIAEDELVSKTDVPITMVALYKATCVLVPILYKRIVPKELNVRNAIHTQAFAKCKPKVMIPHLVHFNPDFNSWDKHLQVLMLGGYEKCQKLLEKNDKLSLDLVGLSV